MYKLSPELQWTAGGYIWPPKTTIQFPTQDITTGHSTAKSPFLTTTRTPGFHTQQGYGIPTREEPIRGSPYYPTPGGGHELVETEADILRIKVEEAGGIPLIDTDIQVCTESEGSPKPTLPYEMPKPTLPLTQVGAEHVYFVSAGELEKLVVNTLLVVYIP